MAHRVLTLVGVALVLLAMAGLAAAQDGGASCQDVYYAGIGDAVENCVGLQAGTVCLGAGPGEIEMASGQVVDTPGGSAALSGMASVRAGDGDAWSLVIGRLADSLRSETFATLIVMGPARLDAAESASPAIPAFTLSHAPEPSPCAELALPGLLVQSPARSLTLLNVNGVDVAVNGTAVIRAPDADTLAISAISRETILSQSGTVVFAGYSARIAAGEPPEVAPYDPASVAFLPVELLPIIEVIPVPGNALVTERVNLHLRPDPASYTGEIVRAGVPVNALGRNTGGDWLHIRTYEGEIGWVPAAALDINVAGEMPVYDRAPARPSRPFGPVQARGLTTPEMSNARSGPGEVYEIVARLPFNTDVGIYAQSPDGQWLMIETPDGTRAWISANLVSVTTPGYNVRELPFSPDFPG